VDFAVSEIPYGLTDGGVLDQPPTGRGYAYMPIVAGGTAFMYNLKIGNTRVTNLRLSGEVLTKIFSQQITNWSDPAIKADNPGLTLPARPIVPVVRSDGSGTTAQFTAWMAAKHGAIWDSYCGRSKCGFTSNFPVKTGIEAKSGSTGVAGFVAQNSSEGSITYVEYSYAKNANFPVVKVLNDAGYYIEPKAASVAVALTKATIRDDLTQVLDHVYGEGPATDPRSYPLSSYSYMILPTDIRPNYPFTPEKGKTLSEFAYYFLCEGQQQADALGYSPLPLNLVQAAVKQVARIPGTTNKLNENNLRGCRNPTFSDDGTNTLAKTAPQPAACDKQGTTQCATGTAGAQQSTPTRGGGATQNSGTNGGSGPGGAGGGGPGGAGGSDPGAAGTPGTAGAGGTAIDPETGLPTGGATTVDPETGQLVSTNGALASSGGASAVPVSVDLPDDGRRKFLAVLAVVLLVALMLGPPLVSRNMSQRRGES
jgi:phosphate ABC transporter phosphate-binding protein